MAILSNLLVHGSGRILNKLYVGDLAVNGSASFDSISGTSITASSSLVSSGTLSVTGASTLNGDVTIAAGKKLQLNNTGNITAASVAAIPLIIGTSSSTHVEYDNDELQSKTNASTAGPLHINRHGGLVYLSTGDKIYANNGTFTASILSAPLITATNVNVSDTLRATRYDLQTIAQTGGSLYVSPTIRFPNSGTLVDVVKPTGATALTITIKDASIDRENMAGAVWTNGSAVKCSGTIDGVITGTMDGTVSSLNVSSHSITIVVSGENWNAVQAGTNIPASKIKDLSVMLYKRHVVDGSNTYNYPVGLLLSCYDVRNNSASIRVYGGSSEAPHVMLGNLTDATDLPQVNDTTPTGWGLFAQNAFLSGTIVSQAGKIGGWTLGSNNLHAGNAWGTSGSAMLCTGSSDAQSIGGSANTVNGWVFTAGANFGVTSTGALYCNSANIQGAITATSGTIAGFHIVGGTDTSSKTSANGGHAYTNSLYRHSGNGTTYEYEVGMRGSAEENPSQANTNGGLPTFYITRIAKGATWAVANRHDTFYITHDGRLYCESANITGEINATSGNIGGCEITNGSLSVDNAHIATGLSASKVTTGTLSASVIGAGSITGDKMAANTITAEKLVITDQTNYVTVTEYDPKSAVTENHPFGEGGDDVVENGYIRKRTATNNWLALSPFITNSLMPGEELYYSITLHGDSVGGTCYLKIWFYNATKGNSGGPQGSTITISATDETYTGTLTVPDITNDANGNPKPHAFFAIGINDTSDTRGQIYCKQVIVRKKNEGNLIVDGAITADKISAGTMTIGASKNILRGTRNLTATSSVGTWLNMTFRQSNSTLGTTFKNVAISDAPVNGITQGIQLTIHDAQDEAGYCQDNYEMRGHVGDVMTYSIWVKTSKDNIQVRLSAFSYSNSTDTSTNEYSTKNFIIPKANTWTFIHYTTPPIKYDHEKISIGYFYIQKSTKGGQGAVGDTCVVCAPMLEWGNTASLWNESTSNDFAGFVIDSSSIHTANTSVTVNTENSVALSSVNFSRVITGHNNNQAINNLRFAIGGKFGVAGDGTLYCSNAKVSGEITATSGNIGGWTINANNLVYGTWGDPDNYGVLLCPAGSTTKKNIANSGDIDGWVITSKNNFGVTKDGALYCNSGKISSFNIASTRNIAATGGHFYTNSLYVQTTPDTGSIRYESGICVSGGATSPVFYVIENSKTGQWTQDGNSSLHWNWYVARNGYMFANNVNITGNINATSGNIGGFEVKNGTLTVRENYNLLKDSYVNIVNSTVYAVHDFYLVDSHNLKAGDVCTIQLKGQLSEGKTEFGVYNSGGNVVMAHLTPSTYDSTTGIYTATFEWKTTYSSYTASNTFVRIYQLPNGVAHASSIEWVKLERGPLHPGWCGTKDDINEVITGTQTASTNKWTGKSNSITELYDGLQIKYWLTFAGTASSADLKLTLANGVATDEIPCYYNGASRITNQYGTGYMLNLTYRENVTIGSTTIAKGWWADANYNTNTWDRHRYTLTVTADTAIARYALIVCIANGNYQELRKGTAFLITKPMVMTDTAMNPAGTTKSTTNTYLAIAFNLTTATQSVSGLAVGKPVYIKGKLSGDTFTPATAGSACLTVDPSADKTYHYMYVGIATSTTGVYLEQQHPVYVYYNNKFMKIDEVAKTYMYFDTTNGLVLSQNEVSSQTDLASAGGNVRIVSTGMKVYNNNTLLASYGSDGIKLYKPDGQTIGAQLDTNGLIINSGKIGGTNGFTIDAGGIVNGAVTSTTAGAIALKTQVFSRQINGDNKTDLLFAIGGNFGVSNDGTLYCSSADIYGNLYCDKLMLKNAWTNTETLDGTTTEEWLDAITYIDNKYVKQKEGNFISGELAGFKVAETSKEATTTNGGHLFSKSIYVQSHDAEQYNDSTYEYEAGFSANDSLSTSALMYIGKMSKGAKWNSTNASNVFYITKQGKLYCEDVDLRGGRIGKSSNSNGFKIESGSIVTDMDSNNRYFCFSTSYIIHESLNLLKQNSFTTFFNAYSNSSKPNGIVEISAPIICGKTAFDDTTHNGYYLASNGLIIGNTSGRMVRASLDGMLEVNHLVVNHAGLNTTNYTNITLIRKLVSAPYSTSRRLLCFGDKKGTNDNESGSGYLYYTTPTGSSLRYKNIHKELSPIDVENFYNVKPVWASYKDDYLCENHYWLGVKMPMMIAEDIEKVFPKSVEYYDGKIDDYTDHLVVSVHQTMLIDHNNRINELESEIANLQKQIETLKNKLGDK